MDKQHYTAKTFQSGQPCPISGYWQCEKTKAVYHFNRGESFAKSRRNSESTAWRMFHSE